MPYDKICSFDIGKCVETLGLGEKDRVVNYIANEIMRLSDDYVPFDLAGKYPNPGRLKDSAHIEKRSDVVWSTPYARRWYYEDANFQGAPTRGRMWVDKMLQNGGLRQIEDGARKMVKK